jgi:hypothetical protein
MSFVFHSYILGLTSWIWTSPPCEELKFESPSKWNSCEDFNLEHWLEPLHSRWKSSLRHHRVQAMDPITNDFVHVIYKGCFPSSICSEGCELTLATTSWKSSVPSVKGSYLVIVRLKWLGSFTINTKAWRSYSQIALEKRVVQICGPIVGFSNSTDTFGLLGLLGNHLIHFTIASSKFENTKAILNDIERCLDGLMQPWMLSRWFNLFMTHVCLFVCLCYIHTSYEYLLICPKFISSI